jgi:triosephosphate isomerase
MRQKHILGNWKMNGRLTQVIALIDALLDICSPITAATITLLVPAIFLPKVSEMLQAKAICFGAQNVFPKDFGPYTGELSGPMLLDYQCEYVLVGHSERRQLFHENEKFVAEKFHHVKEHGMIPVLCVGETEQQREQGVTEQVLTQQLVAVLDGAPADVLQRCVIAYEPVWAIGTGKTATPEQAQSVHKFIRDFLSEYGRQEALRVPIVYGGSVNRANARALFAMPDIDGGLIGGASLDAQQFGDIIECINCC